MVLGTITPNEEISFKKVTKKEIQGLLDNLDDESKRNFTHDIYAEEERLDLGAFLKNKMIAYGFLNFNKQPFRKDLCNLGLVVHPEWQGRGIGTKFVQKLIEEAKKMKIRKIWLNVYSDNPRAARFWLEQGFEKEGFLKDNENWNGYLRSMIQMCMFLQVKE